MSKFASQKFASRESDNDVNLSPSNSSPSWKQEVNRRLAEHRNRKGFSAQFSGPDPQSRAESQPNASRRAAEAAARVAARYAQAPSYSEVLANEARAAIRAAEAASEAALKARAAAESVLAGIESAAAIEPPMGLKMNAPMDLAVMPSPAPAPVMAPAVAAVMAPAMAPEVEFDFAQMDLHRAELSARLAYEEPAAGRVPAGEQVFEPVLHSENPEEIFAVEPVQPILANLIEFPRELVATRRARPRLAEALYAAPETGVQLSIFEVDPVTMQPATLERGLTAALSAPPVWETQWSSIKLDAEPRSESDVSFQELTPELDAAPAIELAPMSLRLMALAVDAALIGGAFLSAAALAARNARTLPGPHALEIGATVALSLTAAIYLALFFTMARTTPGMKYARIRLSTLDGLIPTRAQRSTRLAALLLSVLPLGLGVVWSLFDENHLSWHDRLSGTYLCKAEQRLA